MYEKVICIQFAYKLYLMQRFFSRYYLLFVAVVYIILCFCLGIQSDCRFSMLHKNRLVQPLVIWRAGFGGNRDESDGTEIVTQINLERNENLL